MLGHFVDDDFFGGADGVVFFAESCEESLDVFVGFVGHLGDSSTESVAEGVLTDASFADVGAGSGGRLRVSAIGFNLGLGGHKFFS
jgi:hypothetical protein